MTSKEALTNLKLDVSCRGRLSKFQQRCFDILEKEFETPTLEQVLKEFEELGYIIHTIENYNICLFKYYEQYNEDYSITIDLKNKCYYCDNMDVVIDLKTHQLLTKLFKALGWF